MDNAGPQQKAKRLAVNNLRNIIYKSFIYLNETIVLNVKGKLYRKPGKFITIKGDMCTNRAEELWYVIEVKHKFENGNYRNEIKAVRFLADGNNQVLRTLFKQADRLPPPEQDRVVTPATPGSDRVSRPIPETNNGRRLENYDEPNNRLQQQFPPQS